MAGRPGLIPVKRMVQRGSKPHLQTYWVRDADLVGKTGREQLGILGGNEVVAHEMMDGWLGTRGHKSRGAMALSHGLAATGHLTKDQHYANASRLIEHVAMGIEGSPNPNLTLRSAVDDVVHRFKMTRTVGGDQGAHDINATAHALVVLSQRAHEPVTEMYRGVGGKQAAALRANPAAHAGGDVAVDTLSSWSTDRTLSEQFAKRNGGVVLTARIPRENIAVSHRAFPTMLDPEMSEVVVMAPTNRVRYHTMSEPRTETPLPSFVTRPTAFESAAMDRWNAEIQRNARDK